MESDPLENPWSVPSVQEFIYYHCPECAYHVQDLDTFEKHALDNHEKSKTLFKPKQENIEDLLPSEPNLKPNKKRKLVPSDAATPAFQFSCSSCKFKCVDIDQLAEHSEEHKEKKSQNYNTNDWKSPIRQTDKGFFCSDCEALGNMDTFSEFKFQVAKHFIETHMDPLGGKFELCQYCQDVFPDQGTLKGTESNTFLK